MPSAENGEWVHYASDIRGTRYMPLDQINAGNFGTLEVAWRFSTANLGPRPEFNLQGTPLMIKGTLYATGGGGNRRAIVAIDAKTGELLWKHKTDSGIVGQPTTFRGPDGKQYVAILSGVGGWSGAIVAGGLDPRDPTAALGFINAMKDLPDHTTKGGTLYVFALP